MQAKAKHDTVMLSMDKFPYPQKQARGNEFIPCSSDVYHILEGKCTEVGIAIVMSSMMIILFISHADDVKCYIHLYISLLLANQMHDAAMSLW